MQAAPLRKSGAVVIVEPMNRPDRAEIDRAVFIMNDWSGGQFYIFEEPYHREMSNDQLDALHRQAKIALEFGWQELTSYAKAAAAAIIEQTDAIRTSRTTQTKVGRRKRTTTPKPGYVYLLASSTGAYKIGRASDPSNRLKTFEVKLPFEVEFSCVIHTDDMIGLESRLHKQYSEKHINGEWFALDDNDVAAIKALAEVGS